MPAITSTGGEPWPGARVLTLPALYIDQLIAVDDTTILCATQAGHSLRFDVYTLIHGRLKGPIATLTTPPTTRVFYANDTPTVAPIVEMKAGVYLVQWGDPLLGHPYASFGAAHAIVVAWDGTALSAGPDTILYGSYDMSGPVFNSKYSWNIQGESTVRLSDTQALLSAPWIDTSAFGVDAIAVTVSGLSVTAAVARSWTYPPPAVGVLTYSVMCGRIDGATLVGAYTGDALVGSYLPLPALMARINDDISMEYVAASDVVTADPTTDPQMIGTLPKSLLYGTGIDEPPFGAAPLGHGPSLGEANLPIQLASEALAPDGNGGRVGFGNDFTDPEVSRVATLSWSQTAPYPKVGALPVKVTHADVGRAEHPGAVVMGPYLVAWCLEVTDLDSIQSTTRVLCAFPIVKALLPLRLSQRDDGLALSAAPPRLAGVNAATSKQLGATPRLGESNTYS